MCKNFLKKIKKSSMACRKKTIVWCGVSLLTISCFSGCKMVRDVDFGKVNIATPTPTEELKQPVNPTGTVYPTQSPIVTMEPTENPVTIVVENGPVLNEEGILNYFYSEDKEALIADGYLKEDWYGEHKLGFACDKTGIVLRYIYEYNLDAGYSNNFFTVSDMRNGGAAVAYEQMVDWGDMEKPRFSKDFPEIDLESCSRAEAIAACAQFAQICGYGDAQVKAYAITEEYLKENTHPWKGAPVEKVNSAPKPNYEYVSQRDIDMARESGNEQLAQELENKPGFYDCEDAAWTKEHEAYILVYNSMLNGRVLDDSEYNMYCVYVPLYDSIILVNAEQPLVAVEGKEETELITQDEAIEKVIRYLAIESLEDIIITGISMVYCSEYEKVNQDLTEWIIDPCWRIDYELSDRLLELPAYKSDKYSGTVIMNAVDGKVL